jgi:hypothetical protein
MSLALRAPLVAVALLALFATGATARPRAPAQQPAPLVEHSATLEQEIDAGYGQLLTIATGPHGSVQVSAWRDHKIRVEARVELHAANEADLALLATVVGIDLDPGPTSVTILTHGTHDPKWMKHFKDFPKRLLALPWRVDYVVWVPEYTALNVEVADGETLVDGINGIVSVVSERGDVRVSDISGPARLSAAGGNLEVTTRERSWRGGNLSASCSGDLSFVAPAGFNGDVRIVAGHGATLEGPDETHDIGTDHDLKLGTGGSALSLAAGGAVTLSVGAPR